MGKETSATSVQGHEELFTPITPPNHPRKRIRTGQNGLKMSSIHPFGQPKGTRIIFGKRCLWRIFEPLVVPKWLIFKTLSHSRGPKLQENGLKTAQFQFFVHSKWSKIIFGKTHFRPIFDLYLVPKQPIFKALWDFWRAKTGNHRLKTGQEHLFWHSMWSTIIFENSHLLPPMDLVDLFWHPPLWASSTPYCSPAGPRTWV